MAWTVGSITTLLSTELNSLATATACAVGPAYDNRTNLNTHADFELVVTFGSAATAGTLAELWLVPTIDGTNYVDGGGAVIPAGSLYVGAFEFRATTAHRLGFEDRVIPTNSFKAVLRNNAGVSFPATSSTVKMVPKKWA